MTTEAQFTLRLTERQLKEILRVVRGSKTMPPLVRVAVMEKLGGAFVGEGLGYMREERGEE